MKTETSTLFGRREGGGAEIAQEEGRLRPTAVALQGDIQQRSLVVQPGVVDTREFPAQVRPQVAMAAAHVKDGVIIEVRDLRQHLKAPRLALLRPPPKRTTSAAPMGG